MVKRIYKYPTGAEVPEGAVYLKTLVEEPPKYTGGKYVTIPGRLVWHYFLVEVDE